MTLIRIVAVAAIAVGVSAYAATGGTIGGLLPAPKFLKGEIRSDIYYAPKGVVSVAVPFLKGSYEFKYLQVQEQFHAGQGFVVFGPAAFDQGRYRVEVLEDRDGRDTIDVFNEGAPILLQDVREMMQKDGRAPLEVVAKDEVAINGHPTRHEKARQHAPAGVLSSQPEVLTYDFFILQFGKKVAVVMVMRPEQSAADPPAISVASFVNSIQVQ